MLTHLFMENAFYSFHQFCTPFYLFVGLSRLNERDPETLPVTRLAVAKVVSRTMICAEARRKYSKARTVDLL